MKAQLLSLILLFVSTSVSADNRLQLYTYASLVEHNMVRSKDDPKKIGIDQLIAYKHYYDFDLNREGLVVLDWVMIQDFDQICVGNGCYIVVLKTGGLVFTPLLYESVENKDIEQLYRKKYYIYSPIFQATRFKRRYYSLPRSFVIEPVEEKAPSKPLDSI